MNKLILSITLLLAACSDSAEYRTPEPISIEKCANLPMGLTVVEQSPYNYFIRLSSSERVPATVIRATVDSLAGKYDRIDFCTDDAHERGDEYASVIGNQIFDHYNDVIYSINYILE